MTRLCSLVAFAALLALHAPPALSAPPQPPPAVEAPAEAGPFRWSRAWNLFHSDAARFPTIETLMLGSNERVWRLVAATGLNGRDGRHDPSSNDHVFIFRKTHNPFEGSPSVYVHAETSRELWLPVPVRFEPRTLVFAFEGWNGRTNRFEPRYEYGCRLLEGRRLLCRWQDLLEDDTLYVGLEPETLLRRQP